MEINRLVRKNISIMKPYSSARDEFEGENMVFFDANENPYTTEVNRYPDPYQKEVKKVIAKMKGVNTNQILLGNGSDEVLDLLFRAFCEPKEENIVTISPSYGMYKVLANLNDVVVKEVSLEQDFTLDPDKLLEKVDDKTKIIMLCSPNNPTGNSIPFPTILTILTKVKCLVVVDEAYIDFSEKIGLINYLNKYNQLIVIQTLSKYYGMAGLRLGMCFSNPDIIGVLTKIKPPYNINVLTQQKVIEQLKSNLNYYKAEVIQEKKLLSKALHQIDFVKQVFPSDANFVLVKVTDADAVYNYLLAKKIVVRNRSKEPLCENCLRITVGTPQENKLLIKTLMSLTI